MYHTVAILPLFILFGISWFVSPSLGVRPPEIRRSLPVLRSLSSNTIKLNLVTQIRVCKICGLFMRKARRQGGIPREKTIEKN